MAIDPQLFRQALSQFASGITVITTRDAAGRAYGLTASAFTSVSLEPPLVLVSVDLKSDSHPGFREGGKFAVSILAEGQDEISRRFAWKGGDRFAGSPMLDGELGLPLVPGALAHLECEVVTATEAGDHILYLGRVLFANVQPGRPLVYHRGGYRLFAEDAE
jgi:flavin reductase (DIM6/NTAB) family NADH-FMN oxidoreductase RutF